MPITKTGLSTFCALATVFGVVLLSGWSRAQVPELPTARPLDEKKMLEDLTAKRAQPPLPSLEKMLMSAMNNNPDILVAKSKVREAEAELHRTQLRVARQIITLRFAVENKRERVEILQVGVQRETMTTEPLREALVQLSALEAELQYMLGGQLSAE